MCIMSGKDKNRNCPICNEKLESLTSLHLHCVRNHARNFICCAICYELFKHRSDLVKHSNAQHDRRTKTSNRVCGGGLESADKNFVTLFIQIRSFHFVFTPFFQITKQDFKAFKSLNFVKRMVDGSKCMACSKYFKNQYIAQTHYRDLHLMVKFLCHRCPEIFTTINNLKCHFDVEHANETAVSMSSTCLHIWFAVSIQPYVEFTVHSPEGPQEVLGKTFWSP